MGFVKLKMKIVKTILVNNLEFLTTLLLHEMGRFAKL